MGLNEMFRLAQNVQRESTSQSTKHEPTRVTLCKTTVISPPTVPNTKSGRVMLRRPSGTYILYGPAGFSECYALDPSVAESNTGRSVPIGTILVWTTDQ